MEKFDKYIKKHTQDELKLPSGLSWDEMDIPLPNKQRRKRRGWLFLLFGFGLLVGIIGTRIHVKNSNSPIYEIDTTVRVENSNQTESDIAKIKPTDTQNGTSNIQILSEENVKSGSEKLSSKSENKVDRYKLQQRSLTQKTKRLKDAPSSFDSQTVVQSTSIPDRNQMITKNQLSNNTFVRSEWHILTIPTNGHKYIEHPISIPVLEASNVPPTPFKTKNFTIFTDFGITHSFNSYSDGPQSLVMNQAVQSSQGTEFHLGLRWWISDNLFVNTSLYHQNSTSVFMYTEHLGTEDLNSFQSVTRYRHICHTNNLESIGLNIGLGREIQFSSNWGSELSMSLSYARQLNSNGRFINDDLSVLNLDDFQTVDRAMLNVRPAIGIYYEVNQLRFTSNLGWQHGLLKNRIIADSDMLFTPRTLNISLGVERRF